MLQSIKQPVDIYFASWKKPNDAKNSRGDPIGYFMFIDTKFRWDSLVSFGGSSMAAIGEQSAAAEAASSAPQLPVPEQILPGRVRLAQGASQAMAKGIQGKVNMLAIISKTGEVADLRLIDGDPLLASAAMDAVKQWKYRPYLLQGKPVEVETKITYNFTIAGKN